MDRVRKRQLELRLLARKMPTRRRGIVIRDNNGRALFDMIFFDEDADALTYCPGGGNLVADALRRRGIDPHSVVFMVWDVYDVETWRDVR